MKRAVFLLAGLLAFLPVLAAPDAMTDLAASAPTKAPQLHVTLTFTAPSGATSYDIRYSTSLITSANFSSASVAGTRTLTGSTITPGSVGTVQSTEILGLTPNTLYYFAMKSSDGVTPSAMSNVVTITTAKYPGYGYAAVGGGDGTICRVNSLSDGTSGSGQVGTFRYCVGVNGANARASCSTDPRTIVFQLGGQINLGGSATVIGRTACKLTIDGSTAPSPGITLAKTPVCAVSSTCPGTATATACEQVGEIKIGEDNATQTQNIIATYLRAHGNWQQGWGNESSGTQCEGGGAATFSMEYNIGLVVFDHMTIRNAGDGATDIWTGTRAANSITVSNTLMAWSNHPMLLKGQGETGAFGTRDSITLYRNVYARCGNRMPSIVSQSTNIDFRNNIVYDWASTWSARTSGDGTQILRQGIYVPSVNVVGNYFKAGPNAGSGNGAPNLALFYGSRDGPDSTDGGASGTPAATCTTAQGVVVSGITATAGSIWTEGNTFPAQTCYDRYSTIDAPLTVPTAAQPTTISSSSVLGSVLPDVGTHYRTDDEIALLNDISPTSSAVCGNGVKEGGEVCDGTDFGTDSCVLHGFVGGTLTCDVTCGIVTTPNCTITAVRRSVMQGVTIKGGYIP